MEFELIDNILHIKSSCFSNKGIVKLIEENFVYILKDFFKCENIHSMHDFIVNWSSLKERFEVFFEMAIFVASVV